MPRLPTAARAVLWGVAGVATAMLAVLAVTYGDESSISLGWRTSIHSVGAILLLALVRMFPICLGSKVRATLDGVVIFAVVLLFDPLTAAVITMTGVAIHHLVYIVRERWPTYFMMFNVAQYGLSTALASLTLKALHLYGPHVFASGPGLGGALGAAFVYFFTNTILVAAMSASVQGRGTIELWWSLYRTGWMRYAAVLCMGMLVAVVFVHEPLILPIILVPLAAVHQSFSSAVSLRDQTRRTLEALADVIDRRDPYTFAHSQRVSEYARLIAQRLGLPGPQQDATALAARVHDLGKIGVRDELLKKPGRLTQAELEEVHRHTKIGTEIVDRLADFSNSKEAILFHHERWDGSGIYHLAHGRIPLGARIIAVADAYDAMTSDRPYRRALSREVALTELEKGKESQFDPLVVEAFKAVLQAQEDASRSIPPAAAKVAPSAVSPA